MNWPQPLRVVGVGSPRGDDALGWEAIRQLRERWSSEPTAVAFHAVDGGQRLLDLLNDQGALVVIDAVTSGQAPGRIFRFEWPDPCVETLRPGSTHELRPAEALRLAAALGILPPRVVVFGMEAERFDPGSALSPRVADALPELVRRVGADLFGP